MNPGTKFVWSGRVDAADGDLARRWHQVVSTEASARAPITLLGLASDAGVTRNGGRAGASEGPVAIRSALANLAAHRVSAVWDLGDVSCAGDELEAAQADYARVGARVLARDGLLLGLGGGHEIAWASYCALRDSLEAAGDKGAIGIINLDAHLDLRNDARANSGTPFRQILEDAKSRGRRVEYRCFGVSRQSNTAALFKRAESLGVEWVEDVDMRPDQLAQLTASLRAFAARFPHLYLTICLDVLPGSVAPGVSAPAALGVDPVLVDRLVGLVARSNHLRVADIAEMNPRHDIDGRTARLAARLVARIAESHLEGAG